MRVMTDDGVGLHVEVTGSGPDILFIHEFSGSHISWEPQVRHFARRYRCITFAARGFRPSDVPQEVERYSQDRVVADALAVLDAVESRAAHVVGLSMGGFTALNLAIEHPGRVRSVAAGACGYGAGADRATFQAEADAMATVIREQGCAHLAELTAASPYRLAFAAKDPRGFAEWKAALAAQDPIGLSNTLRGVQRTRPTLPELADRLADSTVPILLMAGDEDDPCLEANLAAKRRCPTAGLCVFPKTAHTLNLEEPAAFDRALDEFFAWCEAGAWPRRNPRSQPAGGGWIR
jgi:pimeloyl-ACP methyl ester carboxylesterase